MNPMEQRNKQPQQDMNFKPAMYPSLVIGCGGTGVKALRHLRRRLREEFGRQVDDDPQLIQLLGVDTVPLTNTTTMEALHQHEYAYIGGFNASRVIENLDHFEEINAWWDYDTEQGLPLGFISTGARQLRVIGRLAFFRRFHTYNSRLTAKLSKLPSIQLHQKEHRRGRPTQDQVNLPNIFIIASLAGGTGSGVFLDIGNHLKDKLGEQARVIAILVLPSVFKEDIPSLLQQRRIEANTYAALKELDYFQGGKVFSAKYPTQPEISVYGRAFDFVYLLDRANSEGFSLDTQEHIQRAIADFIFLSTVSPMASDTWENDVNVTQERIASEHSNGTSDLGSRPLRSLAYSAMGVSRLEVDERSRFQDYFSRYARALRRQMTGVANGSVATAVDETKSSIDKLALDSSKGVGIDERDRISKQYREQVRFRVVSRIHRTLETNLASWGIANALDYTDSLRNHYITYLDSEPGLPISFGQETEDSLRDEIDYLYEELDDLEPTRIQNFIDLITFRRRDHDDAEEIRILNEIDGKKRDLETHLMLSRGVAPDIALLLESLRNELSEYENWLQKIDLSLDPLPSLAQYPLLTVVDHGDSNGRLSGETLNTQDVQRVAGQFISDWFAVKLGDRIRVERRRISLEEARKQILREAFTLADDFTRSQSSLKEALDILAENDTNLYDSTVRDFIRRCVPYCKMDFDRWSFSENNIERTNLLALPETLAPEFHEGQGRFKIQLDSGVMIFQVARGKNPDYRMDALTLAHGFPIGFYKDLPDMYVQYMSDDLGASPLHLRCAWRTEMPDIHFPWSTEPTMSEYLKRRLEELQRKVPTSEQKHESSESTKDTTSKQPNSRQASTVPQTAVDEGDI